MKLEEYRNDIRDLLVRVDTRQEEMYHRISRIEKHLERLNGKIAEHENWNSAAFDNFKKKK